MKRQDRDNTVRKYMDKICVLSTSLYDLLFSLGKQTYLSIPYL